MRAGRCGSRAAASSSRCIAPSSRPTRRWSARTRETVPLPSSNSWTSVSGRASRKATAARTTAANQPRVAACRRVDNSGPKPTWGASIPTSWLTSSCESASSAAEMSTCACRRLVAVGSGIGPRETRSMADPGGMVPIRLARTSRAGGLSDTWWASSRARTIASRSAIAVQSARTESRGGARSIWAPEIGSFRASRNERSRYGASCARASRTMRSMGASSSGSRRSRSVDLPLPGGPWIRARPASAPSARRSTRRRRGSRIRSSGMSRHPEVGRPLVPQRCVDPSSAESPAAAVGDRMGRKDAAPSDVRQLELKASWRLQLVGCHMGQRTYPRRVTRAARNPNYVARGWVLASPGA